MRYERNDRGATAIFLAMVLLLLIGVSAVALDLARGWNERRQDQTAVDVAGVAGALSFDQSDTVIVDQVMDTARQNLDTVYSDADWDSQWASCAGPPPAGFTALVHSSLGTIDCIGISASFLWVRLPEQTIDTSFAKVIGFDTISTGAEATVTLLPDSNSGALPFAILGDATPGEVCLDTGTGGSIEPPCDGNESGSFGNIAPPMFGNPEIPTSPSCGNQTSANNYVPQGIAMGIDHRIWAFSQSDWNATSWSRSDSTSKKDVDAVANMDECIDTGDPIAAFGDGRPINAVYVDTGNSVKTDVTEGLVTGTGFSDGDDARLTRTSNPRSVDGYSLDNVPLWDHLLEDSDHGITICDGSDIRDLGTIDDKNDAMRDCLEQYPDGVSPAPQIFGNSILNTPRVGIAPRLWHDNLGSGLSYRPVEKFDIVYLHGLWFDDKDDTVLYPGESGTLNMKKWKDVEQVTGYLLDDNMVSATVHDELGGQTNDTWQPGVWE